MVPANPQSAASVSRRTFLKATAAAGAGLALAPTILGAEAPSADKELRVALIGFGAQGYTLAVNCLKIPGLQFAAVCDIWPHNRQYGVNLLKKYHHDVRGYEDYQEMLASEKALDAVIIASPDWVHAEHAIACLKAGKHVYCEKEMSNSLEKAKDMVVAARETQRLLQIGHQRRSNVRYLAAFDWVTKKKCCGRVTQVTGQWNRCKRIDPGWPQGSNLDEATLKKYGYDTMRRLRNWRWYKKFSGGAISDLGSHQVDIFNWFLGAAPRAVMANGGRDYYEDDQEWYDTLNALYEWDVTWEGKKTVVRGFYQLLTNSSHNNYAETFIGDRGSMGISEHAGLGGFRRELIYEAADWEATLEPVIPPKPPAVERPPKAATANKDGTDLDVDPPSPITGRLYKPIAVLGPNKSEHLPHLENFFDAIRRGVPLHCPPEVAYETAVSVLRVNEAVEAQKRLEFKPEEFKV